MLTPIEVLAGSGQAEAIRADLARVPGIATVVRPATPDSNRAGTTVLLAVPQAETVNAGSLQPVRAVRSALRDVPGVIGVAGDGRPAELRKPAAVTVVPSVLLMVPLYEK